jgi:hypothetical protein
MFGRRGDALVRPDQEFGADSPTWAGARIKIKNECTSSEIGDRKRVDMPLRVSLKPAP